MTPCPTSDRDLRESAALAELMAQTESLRAELRTLGRYGALIGQSAAMQGLYDAIGRVASHSACALITGEPGTGKALVAQTVHDLSTRRRRPFRRIDCRAMKADEFERDVLRHLGNDPAAGGVMRGSSGHAQGGTLFLAHVDWLPSDLQFRLLNALDSRLAVPADSRQTAGTDVCVLASTCLDPRDAVRNGATDADTSPRLKAPVLRVPSLRERGADIEMLAVHFLARLNRAAHCAKILAPAAIAQLRRQRWPGNVRELDIAVEHAFATNDGEWITQLDPIDGVRECAASRERSFQVDVGDRLDSVERRLILATVQHSHTKEAAAQMLGVSVKTLYNRLRAYSPRPKPVHGKADASASAPQRGTNAQ